MARQQQWMELQRVDRALEIASLKPHIWVHRPIYLHEENTTGDPCPCCDSPYAIRTKEIEHLDLLLHRHHGTRRLRHEVLERGGRRRERTPSEIEQWDEFAAGDDVEVIEAPLRCYREQLAPVLDHYHKVVYVSGGQGSGKTNVGGEWCFDSWMLFGGRGVQAGWVSATRELAFTGVTKLFEGEYTANRFQAPLFDPRLVRYHPPTETTKSPAVLIDGTRIHFLHAGKKTGGSVKAKPFRWVNVDELTEIQHENNWETILGRTGRTNGTVMIHTTPRGGHWGKKIHDRGRTSVYFRRHPEEDGPERYVTETLSALRNIFIDREEVKRTIAGRENEPAVRREWGGEWIGDGNICWRHFLRDPREEKRDGKTYHVQHLRTGAGRSVEWWGLENVTPLAYIGHFPKTRSKLEYLLGQDNNLYPQHTALIQIGCPPGESADPRKWILFVIDEMVRPGTALEHARYLMREYHDDAQIERLRNPAMVIDGTSTGRGNRYTRKQLPRGASTLVEVFRAEGIDAQPPVYNRKKDRNQEGFNPHQDDAASMIHHLMESRVMVGNHLWPRIVAHERCRFLLEALRVMEVKPSGRIVQGKGVSEEHLGSVQSVWYPAWPVFGREVTGGTRKKKTNTEKGFTRGRSAFNNS